MIKNAPVMPRANRSRANRSCGFGWAVLAGTLWMGFATDAAAQMVQTNIGNQNLNSDFSESFGVALPAFSQGNFSFNPGGLGLGAPASPFGPPVNPSSIGVGFPGGGGLRLFGGQSSNRSNVSTTASLTTTDGVPGSIQAQTIRPFVTSFTPVVGGGGAFPPGIPYVGPPRTLDFSPGASMNQTIHRAAQTRAVMRQQIETDSAAVRKYVKRAERGESIGNLRMARANYRLALRHANPPTAAQIQQRISQLGQKTK